MAGPCRRGGGRAAWMGAHGCGQGTTHPCMELSDGGLGGSTRRDRIRNSARPGHTDSPTGPVGNSRRGVGRRGADSGGAREVPYPPHRHLPGARYGFTDQPSGGGNAGEVPASGSNLGSPVSPEEGDTEEGGICYDELNSHLLT